MQKIVRLFFKKFNKNSFLMQLPNLANLDKKLFLTFFLKKTVIFKLPAQCFVFLVGTHQIETNQT